VRELRGVFAREQVRSRCYDLAALDVEAFQLINHGLQINRTLTVHLLPFLLYLAALANFLPS